MTTSTDAITLLRDFENAAYNYTQAVNGEIRGLKTHEKDFRRASKKLLKELLGRSPTKEEVEKVMN